MHYRFASIEDVDLYFEWANDSAVRQNSLVSDKVQYDDHVKWFSKMINDQNAFLYLFFDENNEPIGQVRIEKKHEWILIGQSVAAKFRGKKYSIEMLQKATDDFLYNFPSGTIISLAKSYNIASLKMCEKTGFTLIAIEEEKNLTLVLKGNKQNDPVYILKAKHFYNLV